ncbi:MAG: hypothetical protein A2452_02855 [Candidatus Firestonebacteria bacterium RIFOXYC2_FULL_39_67]|nr:MAG: hypothetical protein A2536_02270 [Candidatus Firestonebacteria bacterium RIFOXYD2_FULL_39_29]OGF55396.1 MAG: hypothetical protein A2452_02855 [Candidatus Firestonebacteria bacterium RIFOXYC2_FULL_39_67]
MSAGPIKKPMTKVTGFFIYGCFLHSLHWKIQKGKQTTCQAELSLSQTKSYFFNILQLSRLWHPLRS